MDHLRALRDRSRSRSRERRNSPSRRNNSPAARNSSPVAARPVNVAQRDVRVNIVGGTFVGTHTTDELLKDIGGYPRLVEMCNVFYDKVSQDKHIEKFVTSFDEPHGERLGTWIAEKMGGEPVWTSTRPADSRQRSHAKAWTCPKREVDKQGRRFKLDDTRMWMRLMFWSAREVGLSDHPVFWKWYVGFIGHFIAVYERSAPPYAQESADWSASKDNIARYIEDGRDFKDIQRVNW